MRLTDQRLHSFVQNVRINLRGRDIGMAEHLLKGAQIGTMGKQVAAERKGGHPRSRRARCSNARAWSGRSWRFEAPHER